MTATVLELNGVSKRYGNTPAVVDVSFAVHSGQTFALLGPSGCGKTTILRMIAGFVEPDDGSLMLGGREMRGVRPHERNVGLVFQDYALFPHLTVEQNVAYGLRQRGVPRDAAAVRVGEMLALVRLANFADRRPSGLSGGQQQRVALARAMAVTPEVMLLDEPLSALDAKLRQELRSELKQILQAARCTTLIVTHDQEEAMSLADEIVVMDRGHILQQGNAAAIYHAPRTREVAEFIGRTNWFEGELGATVGPNLMEFLSADGRFIVAASTAARDSAMRSFCVRPERLRVVVGSDLRGDDGLNLLRGTLLSAVCLGAEIHQTIMLESGRKLICVDQSRDQAIPSAGCAVVIAFRPSDCIITT
jgi:putative spermidine/putrescine transport system ATP-binding protein/putrescine transport system ATP-binding protein